MLERLTKEIQENDNWNSILYELAEDIARATRADRFTLYLLDLSCKNICAYSPEKGGLRLTESINNGKTIAAYVARTHECVTANEILGDDRFPEGTGIEGIEQSVLCHPILRSDGQLIGVLELIRTLGSSPFDIEDEEITSSYLAWAGIGIHFAEMSTQFKRLSLLLDFIHQQNKNILQKNKSSVNVLSDVLKFGKEMTEAERCSYFELDLNELYGKLLDTSLNDDESHVGLVPREDIRFPMSLGIAGYTATCGKSLNIEDAYRDERFNRNVDQMTGYTTRSVLCTPVHGNNRVHGVIQLLNKKEGFFSDADLKALEILAGQLSIVTELNKVTKEATRLKLTQEVWDNIIESQSNTTVSNNLLVENWRDEYSLPGDFNSFLLNHCEDDRNFHYYFMHIILEIAEANKIRIDQRSLWHFTLTARSLYRPLEYHNWAHAFSVTHLIYVILRSNEDGMNEIERLSVIVAAICHDLDHRGRNNAFMVNTRSPLGLLYPSSTMERHHFEIAKHILQRTDCDILESLSDAERAKAIEYIEENILATDLSRFFGNRDRLRSIVSRGKFDWKNKEHSYLARCILMTACDLCATAKSWPVQNECARKVYEEFYEQGDEEKRLGLQVLPMMDRHKGTNMAENQIGFISGIALPCFSLLAEILPCIKPMEDQIRDNQRRWELIALEKDRLPELKRHDSILQERSLSFVKY